MKKICFVLGFIIVGFAAQAQQAKTFFDTLQYHFGNVKQGDTVMHVFKFTNKAKVDLLIQEVKTTCSCTVPDYPNKPVKPGESSFIKIAFDSSYKEGEVAKGVNLETNLGEINFIVFANVVIPLEE